MSTLSPEVAAYIRSLEETVLEQKMELVKLQSLTEQLVNLRKKMYGQSSEKIQYVSGEQLSMYPQAPYTYGLPFWRWRHLCAAECRAYICQSRHSQGI